jgi:hypothetical protein
MLYYVQLTGKLPAVLCFAALIPFIIGCGGEKRPSDLPTTYPTVLTVIQDGKPLEGASVNLLPKDTNSRWAASGITDSAGRVDFFTEGKYRGVPEGEYQVTVSKTTTEPSKYEGQEKPADVDPITWSKTLAAEVRIGYRLVDPQYNSRNTTPLTLTVDPKQDENRQIDVGGAYKEQLRRN